MAIFKLILHKVITLQIRISNLSNVFLHFYQISKNPEKMYLYTYNDGYRYHGYILEPYFSAIGSILGDKMCLKWLLNTHFSHARPRRWD